MSNIRDIHWNYESKQWQITYMNGVFTQATQILYRRNSDTIYNPPFCVFDERPILPALHAHAVTFESPITIALAGNGYVGYGPIFFSHPSPLSKAERIAIWYALATPEEKVVADFARNLPPVEPGRDPDARVPSHPRTWLFRFGWAHEPYWPHTDCTSLPPWQTLPAPRSLLETQGDRWAASRLQAELSALLESR